MVELAVADDPDVLCLQELPVWALPRIDNWAGMQPFRVVTRPPWRPGRLAAGVTRLHQGFFRSAFTGQANAILVARRLHAEGVGHVRISVEGLERRLVQAVRIAGLGIVANLHATNDFERPQVPLTELARARVFAESHAAPGEAVVLAGDLNVHPPQWEGWSEPGEGIDQVLVRGAAAGRLAVWPPERRVHNGVVLSDHAPVELVIG